MDIYYVARPYRIHTAEKTPVVVKYKYICK